MGERGMTHDFYDFDESLTKSHKAEDMPFWEETYRKAFPNMQSMLSHRQDGEHQRNGIDRSIILENSKQILIDEKVRWKAYDDIALEFLSDKKRNLPGWVCKPLQCDYIAYAIAPRGVLLFIASTPTAICLARAWRKVD